MSLQNLAEENLWSRHRPTFQFPEFKPRFSERGKQWAVQIIGVGHTSAGVLLAEVVDLTTGECMMWVDPTKRVLQQIIQVWRRGGKPDDLCIVLEFRRDSYYPIPVLYASLLYERTTR